MFLLVGDTLLTIDYVGIMFHLVKAISVEGAVEHEGTERSKHAHHQENEDPGQSFKSYKSLKMKGC